MKIFVIIIIYYIILYIINIIRYNIIIIERSNNIIDLILQNKHYTMLKRLRIETENEYEYNNTDDIFDINFNNNYIDNFNINNQTYIHKCLTTVL